MCDTGNPWVFLPRPIPLPTRYPDLHWGSGLPQPFSWVWVWVKKPTGMGMGAVLMQRKVYQSTSLALVATSQRPILNSLLEYRMYSGISW